MYKTENLIGKKFGCLTVIDRAENYIAPCGKKQAQWLCVDNEHNEIIITTANLKKGVFKNSKMSRVMKNCSHSVVSRRLIIILASMKQRCYNLKNTNYKSYGANGISICDEWLNNSDSFYQWALANGYNDNLTIDRIDGNGNYEPSNCRWVTKKEQSRNLKSNVFFTYKEQSLCLGEWAEILNVPTANVYSHHKNGTLEKYIADKKTA